MFVHPNQAITAYFLAKKAHAGQFRRDGKTPYISHPEAVVSLLSNPSIGEVAAAWLHDILEDTKTTRDDLLDAGIDPATVRTVEALTKNPGEDYRFYLAKVAQDPIALKVKLADIRHNLNDAPTKEQMEKYDAALEFIWWFVNKPPEGQFPHIELPEQPCNTPHP